MRSAIGAALQEAALDPLLTGREHMRLQTSLHGIGQGRARSRSDELLERVGLSQAADRKVGGYSGGMKRRLDLALALVHRPRILFLDEPTTGLDIQSRTALWEEVARLAAEDGVTVFLTTQYLEEADVLADRVGIIDHGQPRRRGHPGGAEGGDRAADGRSDAARRPPTTSASLAVLARFGEPAGATPEGRRGAARRRRVPSSPRSSARSTPRGSRSSACSCTLPRSTTSSWPRPAARWRAPEEDEAEDEERRGGGGVSRGLRTQVGQLARRSVLRTLRQPAQIVPALIFPLFLLAVNSGGLKDATNLPGFPTDSYLTFALAVPFMQGALFSVMNAGTDLARDIETGFLNRLALTPLRGAALLSGLLAGAVVLGLMQAVVYLSVGLIAGADLAAGAGGALVIVVLAVTITVAFGSIGLFAALRTGSGEAVQSLFPVFFVFLFLSSMALPLELIQTDWFRAIATVNPVSYLLQAFRSLLIEGWELGAAGARLRDRAGGAGDRHVRGLGGAEDEAGADMSGSAPSRPAHGRPRGRLAQRPQLPHNPAFLVPSLVFPLFFFISFAGGLSAIGNVPGFDFPTGLHGLPVRLRAAAVGGLRRRLHRLRDRPRLRDRLRPPATCSPPATAAGSSPATRSPRFARALVTWTVLTAVALVAGMNVDGERRSTSSASTASPMLVNVAATLWAAGVAMRVRSIQGGPLMQFPVFLILFLAPVYVPLSLLSGWIHAVASVNPVTALLEAGRGFISGEPAVVALAFAIGLALPVRVRDLGARRAAPRRSGWLTAFDALDSRV